MSRRLVFFICVLAGALGLSTAASAATLEVPGDFSSIQDAVDNADPGDVIEVSKKTSKEEVTVATERLVIKGVGKGVTVQGDTANVFDVTAERVTISNLTVRHGAGIRCAADRCTVKSVRFDGLADDDCVEVLADGAKVQKSRIAGCGNEGVDVAANGAKILKNSFEGTDGGCLAITGNNTRITGNSMRGCEDDSAIDVTGDDAVIAGNSARNTDDIVLGVTGDDHEITENKVRGAAYLCMDVSGTDNRVEENRASNCNEGIEVSGANPRVIGNRVTDTFGDDGAFDIDCTVSCGNGLVSKNLARDTGNDEPGFEITVAGGTGEFRVLDNVADRNAEEGFELTIPGGLVRGNLATRNGFEDEVAFSLNGAGMVFEKNTAEENLGDGIAVSTGSGITISDNVARANFGDGIEVAAAGTVVEDNSAVKNLGDGIENRAANGEYRRNSARGNAVDCANTAPGTIAVNQNNDCADGSDFAIPGEIE